MIHTGMSIYEHKILPLMQWRFLFLGITRGTQRQHEQKMIPFLKMGALKGHTL